MRVCTVWDCDQRARTRGYCGKHYQRWRATGDPEGVRRVRGVCKIEGCEGPHEAHGYCHKHHRRIVRNGDPMIVQRVATGTWAGVSCAVEGCTMPVLARTFCITHYQRWRTHGDPLIVKTPTRPPLTTPPKYSTVHSWLRKAKIGQCGTPGCERTNTEMALIHGQGRFVQPSGQNEGRVYSDRLEDYVELCAKCHRRYDSTSRWLIVQNRDRAQSA